MATKPAPKKQANAKRTPAAKKAAPAPAPAPEAPKLSIIEQVRRDHAVILAAYVLGHSLEEIGKTLEPTLTGLQLRVALTSDDDLDKVFKTMTEERAHHMVEHAGHMATTLVGKDGVDSMLKVAAKIAPHLYGEKTTIAHTGANGGPVKAIVELDPTEAYKRMCAGG